jgi:glycerophosphoryl diester phosphodiesterase
MLFVYFIKPIDIFTGRRICFVIFAGQKGISMKKTICFLSFSILLSCSVSRKAMNPMQFADNPVVAHRGAFKKNGFPENSIAAVKHAINLNCTGSEFDIWMTADDSLVINHDPKFHEVQIETNAFATLAKNKLSNGEGLPTLREYIKAGMENNTHTRLVFEIKPSTVSKERGANVALRVLNLVREMKAEAMAVYISFDYNILTTLLKIDPSLATQYLNGDKTPEQLKKDGITGADYHFSVFRKNPEWIASAKKLGVVLNAWTVNDPKEMEWFLDNGFQFITTNEPELLFEKIAARKK